MIRGHKQSGYPQEGGYPPCCGLVSLAGLADKRQRARAMAMPWREGLRSQGLVTEDEYAQRRSAILGAVIVIARERGRGRSASPGRSPRDR